MPSYIEVALLAARTIEIDVRGIKFKVTENLMRSPKTAIAVRKRITKLLTDTETALAEARKAKKGAKKNEAEELDIVLASAKMHFAIDEREQIVEQVCTRIRTWDVLDMENLPLPLTHELYEVDVPTEFLRELLAAVDAEPIVPKAKS